MNIRALIKPLITLVLLGLALGLVDFGELVKTLTTIPLWVAAAAVAGYMLGQVVSAYKWWLIANAGGIECSFLKALRAYFIGMFANFFGLGLVGGDLARGIILSQGHPKKTPAVASVVADRAQGLAVLALMGIFSVLAFGRNTIPPQITLLLAALGLCILLGWYIGPYALLKITPRGFRFRDKIEEIARVFPRDSKLVFLICVISAVFHLIQISLHWLIILGMEVAVPFSFLLMVIPCINILSSLPISWNGLGVRENGYIYFLAPLYLTAEQAVAVGAIWLFAVVISSLIGGGLALLGGDYHALRKKQADTASAGVQNHSFDAASSH